MGVIQSCPHCGEQMGAFAVLHSGLGPAIVTCDVTGQEICTGRKEWRDMGVLRRTWYCLMSTVYGAGFGLWGGLMAAAIVNPNFGANEDSSHEPRLPPSGALFGVVGFAAFFVGGIVLQMSRIRGSLKRTDANTLLTHRASRRCFNGQITTVLSMLLLGAAIVLLSKWIHSLRG